MKQNLYNKWLPLFILIQPFFDVITSFMTKAGMSVTVGILIKMLILFLMGIYLLFIDKSSKKLNYLYLALIFGMCIGNMYYNFDIFSKNPISYLGYLMKYVYFVVGFLYFFKWHKNGNIIKLHELRIPFAIISITFLLSWITFSAFPTYLPDSAKSGTSGWFFSGNEIGALLSIIFPITLYNAFYNKNSHKWEIIFFIIVGIALLSLGTKVGLLGYFLTIGCYLVYRLLVIKKHKLDYRLVLIVFALVIPLLMWNDIPAVYNTKMKYDDLNIDDVNITEDERNERINFLIYSGRNGYIAKMVMLRENISFGDRFFGTFYFYEKSNEIIITEQDIFDVYFLFGISGLLLLIIPVLYVLFKCLKLCIKEFKLRFCDVKTVSCLISIVIALGVSTMSGHTLLAPSVSIFILIIIINLYDRCIKNIDSKDKKSILIGSVHMETGGIERTLISLLKKIDYNKYKVDLLLLKPEGQFYHEIPEEVNVLTPYNTRIMRKIVLSDNIVCKVIKHLCFNYMTGFLFSTNRGYDYAISYSGYYSFIDMLVAYSFALKKFIWVHTDMKTRYEQEEKYRNKIDRVKRKYRKFDKIVCVSEGVKKQFCKLLPEYKDKVTYLWNLMDYSDSVSVSKTILKGDYKIVSVGRMEVAKRFDKAIDVLEKVDNAVLYIIGNGALENALKERIKEKKLTDRVKLLGSQKNVTGIVKQADLFLSTSDYEGLPTVLLESLLVGVPIVATDVCGNSDIYKYIAPKGSMILCENKVDSIVSSIKQARDGKIEKDFHFDLDNYNNDVIERFYKLLGD